MPPSSPSRLPLLAALCIGIAIGALVISALNSQPRTVPRELEPGGGDDRKMQGIAASMEALTEALQRLERRMDEALAWPAQDPVASVGELEPTRQPVEAAPETRTRIMAQSSHWVTVLDERIARALVERGLTPFDPGVARYVRQAAIDLRKVGAGWYSAAIVPLQEDYKNRLISGEEYNELREPLKKRLSEERNEVISQLEAALDALSKGAGAGEDE